MRQRHGVPALRAHPSLWSLDDPAQLIRRACRRYSNGTISPHGLRRYFATQWLARAGSESSLIRLCGWTSGAMLRTYTAANADALALTEYAAWRTRATTSSMNRPAPRWVFAEHLRIRACSTSPVSARVASSGW